jgi:hypothetical protein
LNASALEGTATGAADEHRYSISTDDELLALLRPQAITETIVTQPTAKEPETRFQLNVPTIPTVKRVRQTRAYDSKRLRIQVLTAVACAVLAIVSTTVILRIENNYGTIELRLYHKDAQVTVDGDTVRLRPGPGDDEYLIRIAPGQHKLQVEKNGYTTFTRDIEIAKGEEKIVAITLASLGSRDESPEPKKPLTPALDTRPSTLDSPEPPPLEGWLVGREILTVKQDGSAMFTKIQDALDALKPGQVVEVLDQRPYVETLSVLAAPSDRGLVTRTATQLRVAKWDEQPNATDGFTWNGHRIVSPKGFRLSGFVFHSEERVGSREANLFSCSSTVIEQCCFLTSSLSDLHRNVQTGVLNGRPGTFGLLVRECIFASGCHFGVHSHAGIDHGRYILLRNVFERSVAGRYVGIVAETFGAYDIRENVFMRVSYGSLRIGTHDSADRHNLRIQRNTFFDAQEAIRCSRIAPMGEVAIRDNLYDSSIAGIRLWDGAQVGMQSAKSTWQVANNMYTKAPDGEGAFPLMAGDIVVGSPFISTDRTHRDYLRLNPAVFPKADNGQTIQYGALPPGPAPPEGDWFTRLQERWKAK